MIAACWILSVPAFPAIQAIAFERFFLEAARTAYPAGGFARATTFQYGAEVNLRSK